MPILVGAYLLGIILLSIPAVQRGCAHAAERALSQKIQSEVQIGSIHPGFPNRLIADDIRIYDQQDTLMLQVNRLAAKVEVLPLLQRRIRIRNAQLFGATATLYKPSENEPENFRFLLEAFSSQDTTKHPIDLRIGSLLVRRSNIRYDHYGKERKEGRFDANHLSLRDISLNAQIRQLTPDTLNFTIKRLSLREESGFQLDRLQTHVEAGPTSISVPDFLLTLPRSTLHLTDISAHYLESILKANPKEWLREVEYSGQMDVSLLPSELAAFVPKLRDIDEVFSLTSPFEGRGTDLNLPNLVLSDHRNEPFLKASISSQGGLKNPSVTADIRQLEIQKDKSDILTKLFGDSYRKVEPRLSNLFPIRAEGVVSYANHETHADMQMDTESGSLDIEGTLSKAYDIDANIGVHNIMLTNTLDNASLSDIGAISFTSKVNGKVRDAEGRPHLKAQGIIESLLYKGYHYKDVRYDASCEGNRYEAMVGFQDKNGEAEIQLDASVRDTHKTLNCYAALVNLCPHELGLTDRFEGEHFTLNLDTELAGSSFNNLSGKVRIENLCIHSDSQEDCLTDSIVLISQPDGNEQHLIVRSPFINAQLDGQFRWQNLSGTVKQIMQAYLPSIFHREEGHHANYSDDLAFSAHIKDSTVLSRLLGKSIAFPHSSTLDGKLDGSLNLLTFHAQIPELVYGSESLKHIDCHVQSTPQNMQLSALLEREMKGLPVEFGVNAYSSDDQLRTRLHWDSHGRQTQIGEIDVTGRFYKDLAGKQAVRGDVNQSNLIVNDTIWTVHPSSFNYHDGVIELDSLRVSKGEKYLCVYGRVSENEEDSLVADLHQINLAYIFDMINFHTVDFDGEATGRVYATNLRAKPKADAFLQVKDFTFNGGAMGNMDVHGNWGAEEGSIHLDALMTDMAANHQTSVVGSITPGKTNPNSGINLNIRTRRCNLFFLNKFTQSIFTDLEGRTSGWVRVFGPFKGINLEGELVVDEASTHVNALNVDYRLAGDSVVMRPDNIWIRSARLYDKLGRPGMDEHCAIMDVHLMHDNLKNLRYDVQADARNVLGYDFHDFGDMSFYGTIFATGNVKLTGRPGEMTADINCTPMPGSTLVYNSTSPETITEAGFITYVNPNAEKQEVASAEQEEEEESSSDIRLNFNLNVTSDATLRVLMDARSGDYINLHGNGHILANYYNKGKFSMYGTYHVEDGIYKLSLQDVIHKDFQFQQGGTLSFGGNAQQASLNLKAIYTVPNVSMDDLSATSLGFSNTRVDCIMNITGRPLAPVVTFDFDLPNANEDEKEMVRQMISTDEERNLQVIYLLGIGRFYSYQSQYMNAGNQSTTAVNSLISSSLSSQFNQILSNAMGTDKWSFGANLRTGETGWDQLDVEGILSGRLLNNRLLINGNFGYRESYYSTNNFIGDFDVRYLLTPSGSLALKAYNQTNDRYFIQSSLTTQGIGLQIKKDFNRWKELIPKRKHKRRRVK